MKKIYRKGYKRLSGDKLYHPIRLNDLPEVDRFVVRQNKVTFYTKPFSSNEEANKFIQNRILGYLNKDLYSTDIIQQTVDKRYVSKFYNFYHKEYEQYLNINDIDEKALINMYLDLFDRENDQTDKVRVLNTLNGRVKKLEKALYSKKITGKTQNQRRDGSNFKRLLAGIIKDGNLLGFSNDALRNYNRNLFVLHDYLDRVNNENDSKFSLPFFVDINITNNENNNVSTTLNEVKVLNQMMYDFTHKEGTNKSQTEPYYIQTRLEKGDSNLVDDDTLQETIVYDLEDWFKTIIDTDVLYDKIWINKQSVTLGDAKISDIQSNDLMFLLSVARIEQLKTDLSRNLYQILTKQHSYSEPIFFKVDKHYQVRNEDGSFQINPQPFQSFQFVNAGKDIYYVDAQVVYGRRYIYQLYAYRYAIGEKVVYSNMQHKFNDDNSLKITFDYDLSPYAEIVKVPITQEKVYMLDNPPMYPSVNFDIYKDINNKILIRLMDNSGEHIAPLLSFDYENRYLHDIYESQNREFGGPIRFKTEEPNQTYEIFRTSQRPKSYQDFYNKLIKKLDITKDGSCLKDNIEPNKDYFYIFRSIDQHNYLSNPTQIYQVRLNSIEGFNYLNVTVIDPTEDKETYKKNLRKYLHISPTLNQSMLNVQEIQDNSGEYNPESINEEYSVFGKNYKLRLTSKKTGKMYDINFKFTKKKV